MKDLLSIEKSLTEDVELALNKQIAMEAGASASYLAMASWCMANGFDLAYEYFIKQSDEEREHMKKLFRYVNNMGGLAHSPQVGKVREDFDSLREVYEYMLSQEIAVTQAINNLVDFCMKHKDYSTVEYLNWFVKEQREEVFISRRALKLFDLMGQDGLGLYEIEKAVTQLKFKE
ncbi:ferritin [Aureibacter tunicatorum]|uniref:Ferritin n=1 Tax=Aureibacter tunicatorum TaxID=866807 RepID=A0AAE3XJF9_9BACT|nr:ferritin [Aureibacter tunicatorum]MDR6237254.1 ferritin [Aureibacter tunicatorum]BDD06246.1 ferritin [Aureibacter tunicatorum]